MSSTTRKGLFGRLFPKKAADDSDIKPRPRVTTGSARASDRTLRHSRSMSGLDYTTCHQKPEWNQNNPIREQRIQVMNRGRDRQPSIQYGETDFVRPMGSAPPPPPPPKEGKHLRREQEYLASLQPREVLRSHHNTPSPACAPAPRRTVEHTRTNRSTAPAVNRPGPVLESAPRLLEYNGWRDSYQPPVARSKNPIVRLFSKSPPVLRDERGPYLPEGRRHLQPQMIIERFLQHPSPYIGRPGSLGEESLNSETYDDPKTHDSYVPEPAQPNANYVSYNRQLKYKTAKEDADRKREEIRLAKLVEQQEEQLQQEKAERGRIQKREEEEERLRREEDHRRGQRKVPVNTPPTHHRGSSEISTAATFGSNQATLGHSNYNSSVDSINSNAPASRPLEFRERFYEKRNAYYGNGAGPYSSPSRPTDTSSSRDSRAESSSSRDYRTESSSSRDYRTESSSSLDYRADTEYSGSFYAEPIDSDEYGVYTFRTLSKRAHSWTKRNAAAPAALVATE